MLHGIGKGLLQVIFEKQMLAQMSLLEQNNKDIVRASLSEAPDGGSTTRSPGGQMGSLQEGLMTTPAPPSSSRNDGRATGRATSPCEGWARAD